MYSSWREKKQKHNTNTANNKKIVFIKLIQLTTTAERTVVTVRVRIVDGGDDDGGGGGGGGSDATTEAELVCSAKTTDADTAITDWRVSTTTRGPATAVPPVGAARRHRPTAGDPARRWRHGRPGRGLGGCRPRPPAPPGVRLLVTHARPPRPDRASYTTRFRGDTVFWRRPCAIFLRTGSSAPARHFRDVCTGPSSHVREQVSCLPGWAAS